MRKVLMREILYRGKQTATGEWVYGDFVRTSHFGSSNCISDKVTGGCLTVEPETVSQYTGKACKDGKIFEGDLIRYKKEILRVVWRGAGFIAQKRNRRPMTWALVTADGEIVGNRWDNQELWEEA